MINRIKNTIYNNKSIINNFSYLTILQALNMLAPLLIYPYLIKVLGLYEYGRLVYHQGVILFFSIVINYGFYITGAKDVAEVIGDKYKVNKVVSNILLIKTILWFGCLLVIYITTSTVVINTIDNKLLFFCFFSTFYEWLFVQWFFQGAENLKPISIINGISKVITIILILLFVHTPNDLLIVPLIISIVNFIAGSLSIIFMMKINNVDFVLPEIKSAIVYFRQSTSIFASNFVISIKDRTSAILIGNYLGMDSVAIFDLAMRILNISSLPINIFTDAIFAKAARVKSKDILRKALLLSLSFSFFILIFNQIFMEFIIRFLGGELLLEDINIFHAFICILPISTISLICSRFGLIVFNKQKIYFNIMLLTVFVYVSFIISGYYLGFLGNLKFYLFTLFVSYVFECTLRFIYVKKLGLI